jgi:hypothetical protein
VLQYVIGGHARTRIDKRRGIFVAYEVDRGIRRMTEGASAHHEYV